MSASDSTSKNTYAHSTVFQFIMTAFFFFFAFFKVDPRLIFYAQEPVFFYSGQFFQKFLAFPGALAHYFSNFLAQFFYYRIIGAVIIALLLLVFLFVVRSIFKYFGKTTPIFEYTCVVIASLLIFQFKFPLVVLVALLGALLTFKIFLLLKNSKIGLIVSLLCAALAYYLLAGAFFVYAFLVIFAAVKEKKYVYAVAVLILSAILPFTSYQLFLTTYKQLFFYPYAVFDDFLNLSVALYAIIPVLILVSLVFSRLRLNKKAFLWIQFAFILVGTVTLNFMKFDESSKKFWLMNYLADNAEWQKVLDQAESSYLIQPQILYQINRALLHTGKLCDNMFRFDQRYGIWGLFLHENLSITNPRLRGDIFFDLGNFNEAKHWAHEAMTANGESIATLKRLALVNLLYKENKVAEKYLNRLEQTLIARSWANHYKKYIEQGKQPLDDPVLARMKQRQVKGDFLTFIHDPASDLRNILNENPENKAAFEYLSMLYLLEKRVSLFLDLQKQHPDFCQSRLPKHFQEAYLYDFARNKKQPDIALSSDILKQFREFYSTLQKNSKNPGIQSVLKTTHGNTYWYYLMFVKPTGV